MFSHDFILLNTFLESFGQLSGKNLQLSGKFLQLSGAVLLLSGKMLQFTIFYNCQAKTCRPNFIYKGFENILLFRNFHNFFFPV